MKKNYFISLLTIFPILLYWLHYYIKYITMLTRLLVFFSTPQKVPIYRHYLWLRYFSPYSLERFQTYPMGNDLVDYTPLISFAKFLFIPGLQLQFFPEQ